MRKSEYKSTENKKYRYGTKEGEKRKMKKLLVVVDIQNDFIDGSLGNPEAVAIIPNVVEKINNWDGDIALTKDTHEKNYLETREGKKLPIKHCIYGTCGYNINKDVKEAIFNYELFHKDNQVIYIGKHSFGSQVLAEYVREWGYDYVELIGLCTDICVVSNALLLKTYFPELDITVDARCCAGVTTESHKAALLTMKMCQIDIIGE